MQVFHSLDAIPQYFGPSVAGVGNFDGVHCGHRAILRDVRARAAAEGARSVVIAFDPHPTRVLRPADAPLLITPLPIRLHLLAQTGVDATLVLPFTAEFSRLSARQFVGSVLHRALGAVSVHEGDNFRFGHGATAGMEELRRLGAELGFDVVPHSLLRRRGLPVSSSEIRACIAGGAVEQARCLLGRPFSIRATAAPGRGIGGRLLVPTVNLARYDELKPANGVYVTQLRIGERSFEAITNAGNRPTFGEDSYAIESHLLDYDASREPLELTEETPLELAFLHRLRAERRFVSPDALKEQIGRDIAQARRYHALARRLAPAAALVD